MIFDLSAFVAFWEFILYSFISIIACIAFIVIGILPGLVFDKAWMGVIGLCISMSMYLSLVASVKF